MFDKLKCCCNTRVFSVNVGLTGHRCSHLSSVVRIWCFHCLYSFITSKCILLVCDCHIFEATDKKKTSNSLRELFRSSKEKTICGCGCILVIFLCFSFDKGDTFIVHNELENEWLWVTAERTKESGLVPSQFVEELVILDYSFSFIHILFNSVFILFVLF